MPYCPNCGKELPVPSMKFCPFCGASTTVSVAPPAVNRMASVKSSHREKNILLVVIVILLIVIAGVASTKPPSTTGTQLANIVTVVQTKTVAQTITAMQGTTAQPTAIAGTQYDVVIKYTEKYSSQVGFSQPSSGYTFLILTLQIQNNIDKEFNTNPLYFYVIVNNVKYDLEFATYSLPDTLKSVDVLKGGTLTGSMAFQVPEGTVSYTPTYEAPFVTVNIDWIHS